MVQGRLDMHTSFSRCHVSSADEDAGFERRRVSWDRMGIDAFSSRSRYYASLAHGYASFARWKELGRRLGIDISLCRLPSFGV